MKTVINVILFACAAALAWICVGSIVDDQKMDEQIEARKKVVEARLLAIKEAEEAYKAEHDTTLHYTDKESGEEKTATFGAYAESFDELISFLNSDVMYPAEIKKTGQLSEERQRAGWTEEKAAAYVWEQEKKFGKGSAEAKAAIDKEMLLDFRIDTVWVPIKDYVLKKANLRADFPLDSLRYVPFSDIDGEAAQFEIDGRVYFKMDIPMYYAMECAAPYETFLKGLGNLGDNKRKNMTKYDNERGAYPGLKIGDLENWNNNAGNWE